VEKRSLRPRGRTPRYQSETRAGVRSSRGSKYPSSERLERRQDAIDAPARTRKAKEVDSPSTGLSLVGKGKRNSFDDHEKMPEPVSGRGF